MFYLHITQLANIIYLLLRQYTISILTIYSIMTLGQYSFLKNFVDIENTYSPNNKIVSSQISLVIMSILT